MRESGCRCDGFNGRRNAGPPEDRKEDPTGGFTNHTRPENSAAHPTTSTVTSVRCSDSIDLKPWRSS